MVKVEVENSHDGVQDINRQCRGVKHQSPVGAAASHLTFLEELESKLLKLISISQQDDESNKVCSPLSRPCVDPGSRCEYIREAHTVLGKCRPVQRDLFTDAGPVLRKKSRRFDR